MELAERLPDFQQRFRDPGVAGPRPAGVKWPVLGHFPLRPRLSRLNRSHPMKHDTFVLDFQNDPVAILAAFEPYYRTTILSRGT
jgi:hypothetical protein